MLILWRLYLLIYCYALFHILFAQEIFFKDKIDSPEEIEIALTGLKKVCVENSHSQNIPFYLICFYRSVFQIDYDYNSNAVTDTQVLGHYSPTDSYGARHVYVSLEENCRSADDDAATNTTRVTIKFECCSRTEEMAEGRNEFDLNRKPPLHAPTLHSVSVLEACHYQMIVCSVLVCAAPPPTSTVDEQKTPNRAPFHGSLLEEALISPESQKELMNRTRDMFYHAYESYMNHAFPEGELKPVSCEGGAFELIKIPFVTLIDTLDTLVILGDYQEFRKASRLLTSRLPSFDFDVNVSLFETTIRLLGGLLSAHLFSIDPLLNIYPPSEQDTQYDGDLLRLAIDLADRLMPAFNTKTGIPFGTVNLRSGVPKGETKIASTAGAGTLLLEFEVLSMLTGQEKYGKAASAALEGIYSRKSDFDLVGKHINTETGQWLETLSGVGSNSDSFYEYLLKGYSLHRQDSLYQMFAKTYHAIKKLILIDDEWFSEVDMFSGKLQRRRVENLDAFWPGIETLLGNFQSAALQLNAFYSIATDLGFLPEELDQIPWETGKGAANPHYALRPELIESTYYQYRSTAHRSWLQAGKHFLQSIEKYAKTGCGYASINDVSTLELHDSMPSFFLSETCKYLYLLFDEDNFLHNRAYVLSTEAHPFDLNQLALAKRDLYRSLHTSTANSPSESEIESSTHAFLSVKRQRNKRRERTKHRHSESLLPSSTASLLSPLNPLSSRSDASLLPQKCQKPSYSAMISSSFMKIKLQRDASSNALSRHKPLLSSMELLLDEQQPRLSDGPIQSSNSHRKLILSQNLRNLRNLLDYRDRRQSDPVSETEKLQSLKCSLRSGPSTNLGVSSNSSDIQDANNAQTGIQSSPAYSSLLIEEVPAMKELELSLGSLGQFKIKVFADGFQIFNRLEQRSLEISNVGKKAIFLREMDQEGVRSAMAKTEALHSCIVDVDVVLDESSASGARWRRHCAMANFGPSPPLRVEGELAVAEQHNLGLLCDKADPEGIDRRGSLSRLDGLLWGETIVPIPPKALAALLEKGDQLFGSKLSWWKKLKEASSSRLQDLNSQPAVSSSRPSDSLSSIELVRSTSREANVAENSVNHRHGADHHESLSDESTEGNMHDDVTEVEIPAPSSQTSSNSESRQSTRSNTINLEGKIALVKRGECLFEEKALTVQRMGGAGLIVQNRENNLFIMAGKRDVEDSQLDIVASSDPADHDPAIVLEPADDRNPSVPPKEESIATEPSSPDHSYDTVAVPTIMLTNQDANDLLHLQQQVRAASTKESRIHVTVDLKRTHSLLLSEHFGNQQFPKVWMTQNVIYVLTAGRWGAYFKSQKGDDWQMYLIDKSDISAFRLIPPVTIKNRGGQEISTSSTLLRSPEQLYALLLRKKCTHRLAVSVDGRVVRARR